MRIRLYILAAALASVFTSAPPARADDGDDDGLERCINSRLIRSTHVENDRNVIFYMRGGKIYLNTLRTRCSGLAQEGRFSYTTYTRSLCQRDQIHVLRDSGFGIHEGRACQLGMFQLVTEPELAVMFEESGEPRSTKDVEAPSVEDVVDEEDEPPEESGPD